MVSIKFTKFGAHSAMGGFAPGDRMRCDAALARHFVEEAGVAEYAESAPAPAPTSAPAAQQLPVAAPAAAPKASRRKG